LDLKSRNREIYSQLESKRKFVETKKENVDRLFLFYENLKYKQSYLRKQIRICQDLTTPALTLIESEVGKEVVATTFVSDVDLTARHQLGTQILDSEYKTRNEMQGQLTVLEQKLQGVLEKVDKKRKFLDDLAVRVSVVKASTIDLQTQFTNVLEEK
jgi:hypothetical protein